MQVKAMIGGGKMMTTQGDLVNEKELLERIKEGSDPRAMECLFNKYRDFLCSFAHRFQSNHLPFEDAYQVAALGLLKALERFDPSRGTAFITFAYPTIEGELKRHYRDCVEVIRIPRRIRELRREIANEQERFVKAECGEPTTAQVAMHLDLDEEDVVEALATLRNSTVLSLDRALDSERGEDSLAETLGYRDRAFDHMEQRLLVEQLMAELPLKLRRIFELRLQGWTQKSIADELKISQMQVSRLQREALRVMGDMCGLRREPA